MSHVLFHLQQKRQEDNDDDGYRSQTQRRSQVNIILWKQIFYIHLDDGNR
jgi:hypothetical protein